MIPPRDHRVHLRLPERDALDPAPADACSLEREIEACEVRVRCEPGVRGGVHSSHLLLVDHFERIPVLGTSLLLHLDHDEAAAAPQHEIEFVSTYARVGVEQVVSAKSVVAEGAPLAAIHAAS
jgi:hypothetical protein